MRANPVVNHAGRLRLTDDRTMVVDLRGLSLGSGDSNEGSARIASTSGKEAPTLNSPLKEGEPVKEYQYARLAAGDTIRLLKLLPRKDGPLVCKLVVARLSQPPAYEALSYT